MLADNYLPPLIMIVIILLSLGRWVESLIKTKDIRGLSAITARFYLLYFYILILINSAFNSETRYLIFTLGMGAVLLDESIHWISLKLEPLLRRFSFRLNKILKKKRD